MLLNIMVYINITGLIAMNNVDFLTFDDPKLNFNTMPKFERISLIKNLGFNTTQIYRVVDVTSLKDALRKLKSQAISIRSEGGIDNTCKELLKSYANARVDHGHPLHVIEVNSQQFLDFVIDNPCIFSARPLYVYRAIPDPGYLAGAVYIKNREIDVELCKDCFVRDVTHYAKIDINTTCHVLNGKFVHCNIKQKEVLAIVGVMIKLPFNDVIVEVSYYKHPVGYKKENVIIWDLGGVARWHHKNRTLIIK